jgi:quercetin dioxygenase-like cupin family protein
MREEDARRIMHWVGKVDWGFSGSPAHYRSHSSGYSRCSLVDRGRGAIHTDLGVCRLQPGGQLDAHVHSYEEAIYVLGGRPEVRVDARIYSLRPGDYVFFAVGLVHSWSNPGDEEARWLDVNTPQALAPDAGREDTFFVADLAPAPAAVEPDPRDPRTRYIGHYEGTGPQALALAVQGPVRGRAVAGMDTALLAYSGISVKMMVDKTLGAQLLTMFMVDYEPGGAAQIHDHPFEEAYFFLEGEIEAELDGKPYSVRAGDVVWTGVGSTHGFFNSGNGRVRWVETQAPQPPAQHSYRWSGQWEYLKSRLASGGA